MSMKNQLEMFLVKKGTETVKSPEESQELETTMDAESAAFVFQ